MEEGTPASLTWMIWQQLQHQKTGGEASFKHQMGRSSGIKSQKSGSISITNSVLLDLRFCLNEKQIPTALEAVCSTETVCCHWQKQHGCIWPFRQTNYGALSLVEMRFPNKKILQFEEKQFFTWCTVSIRPEEQSWRRYDSR